MKKVFLILIMLILSLMLTHCNTPTESMGQSNPLIEFEISRTTYLKVTLNNLVGDKIITLAKKEFRAGHHWIAWDGKNNNGEYVDEGFYQFCIYYANNKIWRTWLIYYKRN